MSVDINDFSPKELKILEFFAESLEKTPEELKQNLLKSSLNDRARTLAFLYKVPKLYKAVNELLED